MKFLYEWYSIWCAFALQDSKVTAGLKKIPGIPLLYIILNTIVLDKPHQTSLDHVQAVHLCELVSSAQKESIRSLKEEQGISKEGERRGRKRKRKQSNPNPLSCLKKKKKGVPTPPKKTDDGEKKKRSRHRRRKGEPPATVVTTTSWQGLQILGFSHVLICIYIYYHCVCKIMSDNFICHNFVLFWKTSQVYTDLKTWDVSFEHCNVSLGI